MLRNWMRMGRWIVIAVAIGLFCSSQTLAVKPVKPPPPEEPVTYMMVELSDSDGSPAAVNQLDTFVEVVGTLYDNSGEDRVDRAHYWVVNPAGDMLSMDLRPLPDDDPAAIIESEAWDINNDGVIVGSQWVDWAARTPLVWPDGASEPLELPLPDETVAGLACSINDSGVVVGMAKNADQSWNLVAWKVTVVDVEGVRVASVEDTQTIISTSGDDSVYGLPQVANSGYVAATLYFPPETPGVPGDWRACRLRLDWSDDQVWERPDSRIRLFDRYSTANDVNEAGTVCGRCAPSDAGGWGIAYAMTVSGELIDLPVLPAVKKKGFSFAEAYNEVAYRPWLDTRILHVAQILGIFRSLDICCFAVIGIRVIGEQNTLLQVSVAGHKSLTLPQQINFVHHR